MANEPQVKEGFPEESDILFAVDAFNSDNAILVFAPQVVLDDIDDAGLDFGQDIGGNFPGEAGFYRGTLKAVLDEDGNPDEYHLEGFAKLEIGDGQISALKEQLRKAEEALQHR